MEIARDLYKFTCISQGAKKQEAIEGDIRNDQWADGYLPCRSAWRKEKSSLAEFDKTSPVYHDAVDTVMKNVDSGNIDVAITSITDGGEASNARKAVGTAMEAIVEVNAGLAEELSNENAATFSSSSMTLVLVSIFGVIVAIGFVVVISRSITVPLNIVVNIAKAMSVGDLVRDMKDAEKDKVRLREDEIGDIGKAFDPLINYMQGMGVSATAISQNDLTTMVTPRNLKKMNSATPSPI
ncbi:MAG: MCP four helix bundle domain-containing protein [Anaerolineales bacterium]|nr:MCP four helix bundle domain-containing protein [Anaerolineales bacterium]